MQRITVFRRLSQIAFFALTAEWLAIGWLRCPFGVPFVRCASCPLPDCPGRWLLWPFVGLIAVSSLLLGRGFCGWACPMGLVEDALGKTPKPKATVSARFIRYDRWLKPLKYVALAAVLVLIWRLNYPDERAYAYVVRTPSVLNWEATWVATQLGRSDYLVRDAILVIVLVLTLLVARTWCRYLCPLGAILGLFNKFSLLALRRDMTRCTSCDKYPRECLQYTVPGTTDCIICGDCIQGCPSRAVSFGLRGTERRAAQEAAPAPQP